MNKNTCLHILLVDDDIDSRYIVQFTLEGFGYHVSTAVDGHEAVETCRTTRYDLILMDLDMPKMDGLEASREIRLIERQQQQSPVPIIALSGYVDAVDKERCKAAGMSDRIEKNMISAESLNEKLQRWLQQTRD